MEEAVVKINQNYEKAKTASAQGLGNIRSDLIAVKEAIQKEHKGWLEEGKLLEAFGEAFGEAFLFEEAVEFYDRALKDKKSTASIKAAEHLANLRIRQAVQVFTKQKEAYSDIKKDIEAEIKTLNRLITVIGKTEERCSMIGSGYKRLAQIASEAAPEDCDPALTEMKKYYQQAWALRQKNSYPLANAITAALILSLRTGEPATLNGFQSIGEALTRLKELAREAAAKSPDDFWAVTSQTDVKLLNWLHDHLEAGAKGTSETNQDEIAEEYRDSWQQFGSARELQSIIA